MLLPQSYIKKKKKKRQFAFHMLLTEAKYKNPHLSSVAERQSDTGKALEGVAGGFSKLSTDWSNECTGGVGPTRIFSLPQLHHLPWLSLCSATRGSATHPSSHHPSTLQSLGEWGFTIPPIKYLIQGACFHVNQFDYLGFKNTPVSPARDLSPRPQHSPGHGRRGVVSFGGASRDKPDIGNFLRKKTGHLVLQGYGAYAQAAYIEK